MKKKEVAFTMKEATRLGIIEAVRKGKMTNKEAASALKLSVRQIIRIKKKVEEKGPCGILHGNKGHPSRRALPFKDQVIRLTQETYFDFNFTHLSEVLEEKEHIKVSRETVRLWLRPLGFGGTIRKQPRHRRRRKRSEREGQMLFLDGSPHRWFSDEMTTLILSTDDATGKPLYGIFRKEEDLNGCFTVCMEVFKRHGLPSSFYLDRASHFITTRHGGIHVHQRDDRPTHFERAMEELAIKLIFADSPQARGRAERINGIFQDRLVAELRLHNITDTDKATTYVNEIFIPQYTGLFGKEPEDTIPAWRKIPDSLNIDNILCKRYERKVKNDNTISVNGQIIQLLPAKTRRHFVRASVVINHWLDGSWHVFHHDYGEIPCVLLDGVCPAGTSSMSRAEQKGETHGVTYSICRKGDIFMLR